MTTQSEYAILNRWILSLDLNSVMGFDCLILSNFQTLFICMALFMQKSSAKYLTEI